jgi:predicted nucleotidyltransferase
MEINAIIKKVAEIIREHLSGEYKILLFGSWAKGNAVKTSDIDIGILGKKKIDWGLMTKILGKTEEIFTLRKIDIVDLNAVEDSFKNNILKYAKIL